ncbi:Penicillin-binding protein 1A [Oligella sp. MSHR50489EDL]|uniref:penicillin-binding protein 1A n=1 Tax=Oligella sp. MSHR50489EDL TaxID=3139409 RepID=UPI003D819946
MSQKKQAPKTSGIGSFIGRFIIKALFFGVGLAVCGLIFGTLVVSSVWPNLPNLTAMTDYRPRIPLRIYSADKILLAEYGEERRNVLRIDEFPEKMKLAILAAEDDNFYEHSGVDWRGVIRATLANISSGGRAQGASTITMQVARNFYLSTEKSYLRKFYELLLTYKIEENLTKDQILELYMNQIYLGHRSYGFSVAARTYFAKPLSEVTLAEAAVLAGIPKAPSQNNPLTNLKAALDRQNYVLNRMLRLGFITQAEFDQARAEEVTTRSMTEVESEESARITQAQRQGSYVAELARQLMYLTYKDNVYGRGLNVYTTIDSKDQAVAYRALRKNIMQFTNNRPYPGPEGQIELADGVEHDDKAMEKVIYEVRKAHPNDDDLLVAVVLSSSADKVTLMRRVGEIIELSGKELNNARRALPPKPNNAKPIIRGSIVYIHRFGENGWTIVNQPQVEGAFIALDAKTGAIQSMVGGFNFYRGDFNRVTQAWRQPGSTFKPFIYAAGLERGLTPETHISDQPFVLTARQTGSKPWQPKNYGGRYTVSQTMRNALYQSRNMVSIRILEAVGADFARDYITRFGFDIRRQPQKGAYLTMALGAGSVTPLQMAGAYAVFANGGYRVNPYIIDYVLDAEGNEIMRTQPQKAGDEANRVLDARTAYVMNDLLHGVATSGTAARTTGTLGRKDLHGKTGTTNQAFDAWYAGYTRDLVGIAWLGYDQPRSLGSTATGGQLAMPIWIEYMQTALKGMPVTSPGPLPKGLSKNGDNYYFEEFPQGKAVANLGTRGEAGAGGSGDPQRFRPIQPRRDPVQRTIESFNPTGGAPIRF